MQSIDLSSLIATWTFLAISFFILAPAPPVVPRSVLASPGKPNLKGHKARDGNDPSSPVGVRSIARELSAPTPSSIPTDAI